jgi:hypothetical protein
MADIRVNGGGIKRGVMKLSGGDCDERLRDLVRCFSSTSCDLGGGDGGGDSGEASSIYAPENARFVGSEICQRQCSNEGLRVYIPLTGVPGGIGDSMDWILPRRPWLLPLRFFGGLSRPCSV